jgi:hypothetical protein
MCWRNFILNRNKTGQVEQQASHEGFVQDIQQGLQQSVRAVN